MFEAIKRFFSRTYQEKELTIRYVGADEGLGPPGHYIVFPDGEPYAGPYSREADAKGQLTRMRRSYTPANRRVI